jgi:glutamate-1-semialdehyde 2,1-aminomutase
VSAGSGALSFGYPSSAGVPQDFARHTVVCPYNEISAVEEAFHRFRHEIACVIVEPVAGNMGVVLPQKGFLARLRQVTERHGALLVFDEVITGFRLGWGGAQNLFKIEPDITCLGKIVGGGLPMGVFGGPARIMEKLSPLGPVYQAGTLSGNPVAVAAGLKTLRILKSLNPYRALELKTRTLAEGLRACAKKAGRAVQVNQIGSMLTLFFGSDPVRDLASAQACDAKMYGRFFHALLDRGVYIPPSPFEALFVSTAHSIKDIQETLKRVDAAFENL